jgi:hypothetical protein
MTSDGDNAAQKLDVGGGAETEYHAKTIVITAIVLKSTESASHEYQITITLLSAHIKFSAVGY